MVAKGWSLLIGACMAVALATPFANAAVVPTAPRTVTVHPTYITYPGIKVLSSLPSVKGKIFLTVDDGIVKSATTAAILKATPSTLFPIGGEVRKNPGWFLALSRTGRVIEDHTASHTRLAGQSLTVQTAAICRGRDEVKAATGVTPTLFRPPFGSYDLTTLEAGVACGMKYVVLWDVTLQAGDLTTWGGRLKSGDIVLMHFTRTFASDFKILKSRMAVEHLGFANLADYIQ